jgi:hypothetical protein
VNITGLQFFGRDDPAVDEFFDSNRLPIDPPLKSNERSLRVHTFTVVLVNERQSIVSIVHEYVVFYQASAALIYDAVYFFARALDKFIDKHPFNITPLTCDAQKPWIHGAAFALFLKRVDKPIVNGSTCFVLLLVFSFD